MAKTFIWLSFDLGVQGDYESLYAWLDKHKAKECGDSVACFPYTYNGDLVRALRTDLRRHVQVTRKSRFYAVRRAEKGAYGSFIIGSRKSSPWTGFAAVEGAQEVDRG